MTGSFKWLLLAMVFCIFAIVIMLAGLLKNNKIINQPADTAEETEGNKKAARSVFTKHALISAVLIIIAAVIAFTLGKSV